MTNQLLQPKEKQFRWPHGSPFLEKVDVAGHKGRNEGMKNQCIKDYLFWVTRQSQKIRISHCSVYISRDDWFLYLENKIIIGHQIMYRVTFSTCLKYQSKRCQRPTNILRRIDIINIITNFHKLMSKFDALSPLTNDTFLCNMCLDFRTALKFNKLWLLTKSAMYALWMQLKAETYPRCNSLSCFY